MVSSVELFFSRYEYKYLLDYGQYQQISRFLHRKGLSPDNYSKNTSDNNYYVASLYLDTRDYKFYWQKQAGIKNRVKYRLRTYTQRSANHTPVFWEIKKKFSDRIEKIRVQVSWQETKKLLEAKTDFNRLTAEYGQKDQLAEFYFNSQKLNLQPSVLISYWRQPWLDPFYSGFANFRLTFDYNIQAVKTENLFCPARQAPVLPNQIIMEIKFNNFIPEYIKQVIKSFNLTRQALSKYCLGLESCGIVSQDSD